MQTPAGQIIVVNREWRQGDVLNLKLPMHITSSRWYGGSAVIERGPLIYALKMQENWTKKTFEPSQSAYGSWYYEVTSPSAWNYGLRLQQIEKPDQYFEVVRNDSPAVYPWNADAAPVTLRTKAIRMKDWNISRGSCGIMNYYVQQGRDYEDDEAEIELIPYGCTALRITEFPVR